MSEDLKVSRDLQQTVATHPNIKEVHYDAEGNYYFQVYEFKAIGDKEDKKLNGIYGRIAVKIYKSNKDSREVEVRTPDPLTHIVKTVSREEILKAEVNTFGSDGLEGLSPKEKEAILKLRAGTNKKK